MNREASASSKFRAVIRLIVAYAQEVDNDFRWP